MHFLFTFFAFLTLVPNPEFISHRGESFDAPENTIAAFQLAWDRQVTSIELDVHLTADGRLICCHDADTERVAGEKLVIKETTLKRLQALDAGNWKDPRWKGERMPTLEQALATIPQKGRCFVEIKVGPEAVPPAVKAIRESGKRMDQFVIISFKPDTIAKSKQLLPEVDAYYLSSFKKDEKTGEWSPTVEELIAEAKSIHADGLDLSHKGPLSGDSIKKIKASGLKFFVWTIDDVENARKYAKWGAEGITTNRAAWLREQLSSEK